MTRAAHGSAHKPGAHGAGVDAIRYRGTTFRVGQAVIVNPAYDKKNPRQKAYVARILWIQNPAEHASEGGGGGAQTQQTPTTAGAAASSAPDAAANDPRPETLVRLRWYYRPEEAAGGRRPFHAVRELLLSDHEDQVSLGSLMRPARVLPLAEFARAVPLPRRKLDPTPAAIRPKGAGKEGSTGGASAVAATDGGGAAGAPFVEEEVPTYFARMAFYPATGAFAPDRFPVFCTCESAYNPDDSPGLLPCPVCKEYYHPQCVGLPLAEAARLRREMGLPEDPADVGAAPLKASAAAPAWRCPACKRGASGGGGGG